MYVTPLYPTSVKDTIVKRHLRSEISADPTANKILLSPAEAAHILSLAPRTIYALVEAGTLPCVRIGRSVRIPKKAILALAGEA